MLNNDAVTGTETQKQYLARLRRTALTLPRAMVKKALNQMRDRILATVASKGKHIAMD